MRATALASEQVNHEAQHFPGTGFLQHNIERGVGRHAPVAQQPAVDLHRGEQRYQRAGREDMVRPYAGAPACVKDDPLAGDDVRGDNADPHAAAVQEVEIHDLSEMRA
jgi:hypothetical protein